MSGVLSQKRAIRVLAILEEVTITGPAKNLLEFCRTSRDLIDHNIKITIGSIVRGEQLLDRTYVSNPLHEAAYKEGIEVYTIPEPFAFDLRVLTHIRDLVRRLSPDIIQTHHVKSHFLVRLSGVWRQVPWIAFHHGYTTDATRTRFYNQLDRWSLRTARKVVTVCRAFETQLTRVVPNAPVIVLHNSISADWISTRVNLTTPTKRPKPATILAVGRLSSEKDFLTLVLAIGELRQLHPELPIRLIILGEGPEREPIKRAIRRLELNDRVTLIGHVADVKPYFQRADVLAISSVSEGSPNVLLEAMASGLPIVATAVGGIPEIVIDGKTALLVQPRDPKQMAEAIHRLLFDKKLASVMGHNARKVILERYSPIGRAQALEHLYCEVAAARQ
jgi:glycosyltransferase involved in cell wall biosynthesis